VPGPLPRNSAKLLGRIGGTTSAPSTLAPRESREHESEVVMATRRKSVRSNEPEGARAFGVLVEEMRGHFKVFGEHLQGVDQRVKDLDQRVAGLDQRVVGLDQRVVGLDQRVVGLDQRVAGLDQRVAGLDQRVAGLDQRVTEGFALIDARFSKVDDQLNDVRYELGQVKSAVLEHGRLLKTKVDRSEVAAIVEGVLARKSR
jgi:uncharacterized coiled-coil protein SlyX